MTLLMYRRYGNGERVAGDYTAAAASISTPLETYFRFDADHYGRGVRSWPRTSLWMRWTIAGDVHGIPLTNEALKQRKTHGWANTSSLATCLTTRA